jgi:alcohol dehydrogenase
MAMIPIPSFFEFQCPVKTHYGNRALEHLPFEMRALNVAKPLVIGDAEASRDGRLEPVLNAFRNAEMRLGVVDVVPHQDAQAVVSDLAAIYRDKDCDALVAVGQGRTLDIAKWLNLAVCSGEEELAPFVEGAAIPRLFHPLAVIPCAAADGFELSGYLRSGRTTLRSVEWMPRLLFLDKRTTGAPDRVALAQRALVALTHALESFFREDANPMTAAYARPAARLATEVLHRLAHTSEHDQRLALTTAHALALAGCALGAAPLPLTHRLGEALAQVGPCDTGQAMGILLSYSLEYRAVHHQLDAALLLELLGGQERYARTPEGQRGPAAFYFLRNLLNLLYQHTDGRLKRTLQDLGLSSGDLSQAVEGVQTNGEGEDPTGAATILEHAWEGRPLAGME